MTIRPENRVIYSYDDRWFTLTENQEWSAFYLTKIHARDYGSKTAIDCGDNSVFPLLCRHIFFASLTIYILYTTESEILKENNYSKWLCQNFNDSFKNPSIIILFQKVEHFSYQSLFEIFRRNCDLLCCSKLCKKKKKKGTSFIIFYQPFTVYTDLREI
jgi:hypothetical protein